MYLYIYIYLYFRLSRCWIKIDEFWNNSFTISKVKLQTKQHTLLELDTNISYIIRKKIGYLPVHEL